MRGGRLLVTDAARDAVGRLCRDHGRQALLLCWPGGAACLPLSLYPPAALDGIIGHIARRPSCVDLRRSTSIYVSCGLPSAPTPFSARLKHGSSDRCFGVQARPPEPAPRRLSAAAPR